MAPARGLLIDIDGVLVVSWRAIEGAIDALAEVGSAGVPVRFLTNTTSKTRADITSSLRSAGFQVYEHEVLTAASAMAAHLAEKYPDARCLLLNSGDIAEDLPGVDLVLPGSADPGPIDVVLVGGAGPEFTYEATNEAFQALMAGAALVAAHVNLMWRTADGLHLDAGAYVGGLERATGVTATVVGKPSGAMFQAGIGALGLEPAVVAMVGDDIDSDVRGAQAAGLVGVQVRTGKFREAQLEHIGAPLPDVVLDSFADIPSWLGLG